MNLTMTGEVVGTPKYMSPEQCMGKDLDARSDIYALGCVMYEVFTGKPPFDADTFYELVRQHVDTIPSRLPFNQPLAKVPHELEAIIFKALHKELGKRYQTASALRGELLSLALSAQPVS
jgi:serine/threonine-protein kinase